MNIYTLYIKTPGLEETFIGNYSSLDKARDAASSYLDELTGDYEAFSELMGGEIKGNAMNFKVLISQLDEKPIYTSEQEEELTSTIWFANRDLVEGENV